MSNVDVVRAWKDPRYRSSLSAEQLMQVPSNPAGMIELSDDELKAASGLSGGNAPQTTWWGCSMPSVGGKQCGACPGPTLNPIICF